MSGQIATTMSMNDGLDSFSAEMKIALTGKSAVGQCVRIQSLQWHGDKYAGCKANRG